MLLQSNLKDAILSHCRTYGYKKILVDVMFRQIFTKLVTYHKQYLAQITIACGSSAHQAVQSLQDMCEMYCRKNIHFGKRKNVCVCVCVLQYYTD